MTWNLRPESGSVGLLWSCLCSPAEWGQILSQQCLPLLSSWTHSKRWMDCRDLLMWRQTSSQERKSWYFCDIFLLSPFSPKTYDECINQEERAFACPFLFLVCRENYLTFTAKAAPADCQPQKTAAWTTPRGLCVWWYIRLSVTTTQAKKKQLSSIRFASKCYTYNCCLSFIFCRHWRHTGAVSPAIQESVIWL